MVVSLNSGAFFLWCWWRRRDFNQQRRVHKTSGTFWTAGGARRVRAKDGPESNPAVGGASSSLAMVDRRCRMRRIQSPRFDA